MHSFRVDHIHVVYKLLYLHFSSGIQNNPSPLCSLKSHFNAFLSFSKIRCYVFLTLSLFSSASRIRKHAKKATLP